MPSQKSTITINIKGKCSNLEQALIKFALQAEKEKATKNSGNEKSLAKWFFNQSIQEKKENGNENYKWMLRIRTFKH